jgi:hypothetical protein
VSLCQQHGALARRPACSKAVRAQTQHTQHSAVTSAATALILKSTGQALLKAKWLCHAASKGLLRGAASMLAFSRCKGCYRSVWILICKHLLCTRLTAHSLHAHALPCPLHLCLSAQVQVP